MRRLSGIKIITLSAMCIALGVLCLFAAAVLPTCRVACLFLSSLFIYVLCCEQLYIPGILIYLGTAFLGFFIIPDRSFVLLYVAILGHYGIFRSWLGTRINDGLTRVLLRLIYLNCFLGIGIYLAVVVFNMEISTIVLNIGLPVWLLILIAEAVIITFDVLTWISVKFYIERLRPYLISKR